MSPVFFLYASPSSSSRAPLTARPARFSPAMIRWATCSGISWLMSLASSMNRNCRPRRRLTCQDR